MDLNELITSITPLYNSYRAQNTTISGCEALLIMWDIGEYLNKYTQEHKIHPHALFRDIYGKSETRNNVAQKSYINREFLSRSYRIKNIFESKSKIKKILPNLISFNVFKEAMPFFDNPKYKLSGESMETLLSHLNRNTSPNKALEYVNKLQSKNIHKNNPRTLKLQELNKEKEIFVKFYNYVFKTLSGNDYKTFAEEKINSDFILNLSKNTSALSQDGLKTYPLSLPEVKNNIWTEYGYVIAELVTEKNPIKVRRFRRLISPERMVRLADLLYALSSEKNFIQFKSRHGTAR